MILLLDNYDSFVWNLARYVRELGREPRSGGTTRITLDDIAAWRPPTSSSRPGPCTPTEAGVSVEVVRRFGTAIPILGVCLGHQASAPRMARA